MPPCQWGNDLVKPQAGNSQISCATVNIQFILQTLREGVLHSSCLESLKGGVRVNCNNLKPPIPYYLCTSNGIGNTLHACLSEATLHRYFKAVPSTGFRVILPFHLISKATICAC